MFEWKTVSVAAVMPWYFNFLTRVSSCLLIVFLDCFTWPKWIFDLEFLKGIFRDNFTLSKTEEYGSAIDSEVPNELGSDEEDPGSDDGEGIAFSHRPDLTKTGLSKNWPVQKMTCPKNDLSQTWPLPDLTQTRFWSKT